MSCRGFPDASLRPDLFEASDPLFLGLAGSLEGALQPGDAPRDSELADVIGLMEAQQVQELAAGRGAAEGVRHRLRHAGVREPRDRGQAAIPRSQEAIA